MTLRNTTIVMVGPHGAGKSTLGVRLAARLGVPFQGEIGRELAEDEALRPATRTAADPQPAFDEAVFAFELLRDLEPVSSGVRVVETWHPGNLAYAARRSPAVAERFLPAVLRACEQTRVLVVSIVPSAATLARRQTEHGEAAFFREIGLDAIEWCRRLGLPVAVAVRNEDGELGRVEEALVARIASAVRIRPALASSLEETH